MNITVELRPCKIGREKALFHTWSNKSEIVSPSPMMGGHSGGVLKWTVGIVEYENGNVGEVLPKSIKFLDEKHKEFYFEE